jgi:hypothetical protein
VKAICVTQADLRWMPSTSLFQRPSEAPQYRLTRPPAKLRSQFDAQAAPTASVRAFGDVRLIEHTVRRPVRCTRRAGQRDARGGQACNEHAASNRSRMDDGHGVDSFAPPRVELAVGTRHGESGDQVGRVVGHRNGPVHRPPPMSPFRPFQQSPPGVDLRLTRQTAVRTTVLRQPDEALVLLVSG